MNHLTNLYKHKCEKLQEQIKNITKMLNEAEGTADPTVFYPTATDMTELGKGAMPGRKGDGKAFRATNDGGYGYPRVPDVNLLPFILNDLDKRLTKYARANPELFLAEILENIPGPYATPMQIVAFILAHESWIALLQHLFNIHRPAVLSLLEMIKNGTATQSDRDTFNTFYAQMYELAGSITANPTGYNTNAGTSEGQPAFTPDRFQPYIPNRGRRPQVPSNIPAFKPPVYRGDGDGIYYQPPIKKPSQYSSPTPRPIPYNPYGPGM